MLRKMMAPFLRSKGLGAGASSIRNSSKFNTEAGTNRAVRDMGKLFNKVQQETAAGDTKKAQNLLRALGGNIAGLISRVGKTGANQPLVAQAPHAERSTLHRPELHNMNNGVDLDEIAREAHEKAQNQ